MKYFSILLLVTFISGCNQPKNDTKPATENSIKTNEVKHTNKLWSFLKQFQGKENIPTLEDIKKQFGEPDLIMMNSEIHSAAKLMKEQNFFLEFNNDFKEGSYYHYKDDEESVEVSKWLYFHNKNNNRIIQIFFRTDNSICGWDWFENVPIAERLGPPK